jgi:hypothetical protein
VYTKTVPFKDFKGKPRNMEVNFNLTEVQVIKLFREFKDVLAWRDSLGGEERVLDNEEVMNFYTSFEEILLSAYGVPSDDGLSFDHDGRYDFEKTALFNATMVMFLTEPSEAMKLVDDMLPAGLEDLIRKADENAAVISEKTTNADLKAEIDRLRLQIGTKEPPASEAS